MKKRSLAALIILAALALAFAPAVQAQTFQLRMRADDARSLGLEPLLVRRARGPSGSDAHSTFKCLPTPPIFKAKPSAPTTEDRFGNPVTYGQRLLDSAESRRFWENVEAARVTCGLAPYPGAEWALMTYSPVGVERWTDLDRPVGSQYSADAGTAALFLERFSPTDVWAFNDARQELDDLRWEGSTAASGPDMGQRLGRLIIIRYDEAKGPAVNHPLGRAGISAQKLRTDVERIAGGPVPADAYTGPEASPPAPPSFPPSPPPAPPVPPVIVFEPTIGAEAMAVRVEGKTFDVQVIGLTASDDAPRKRIRLLEGPVGPGVPRASVVSAYWRAKGGVLIFRVGRESVKAKIKSAWLAPGEPLRFEFTAGREESVLQVRSQDGTALTRLAVDGTVSMPETMTLGFRHGEHGRSTWSGGLVYQVDYERVAP